MAATQPIREPASQAASPGQHTSRWWIPTKALPFLAPVHLLVLGVIVIPAFYVIWLSVTSSTFGKAPTFVGLANYAHALSDPYFWRALRNTIVVVLIVVHVELVVGLGMALLFASGLPARRWLLAAVLAPYAVSEVSAAVIWRFLFDADVGPVTVALNAMGLPSLEWSIVPAHGLIIIDDGNVRYCF